jgi:hypothetical protein
MSTQIVITVSKENVEIVFTYNEKFGCYEMSETIFPKDNIGLPRSNATVHLTVEDTFNMIRDFQHIANKKNQ